jgi:hypothetical protein
VDGLLACRRQQRCLLLTASPPTEPAPLRQEQEHKGEYKNAPKFQIQISPSIHHESG